MTVQFLEITRTGNSIAPYRLLVITQPLHDLRWNDQLYSLPSSLAIAIIVREIAIESH